MVPVLIINKFGENTVFGPIYIDMYKFLWWAHGLPYSSRLLFIKTEIIQEYDLSEKQIIYNLDQRTFVLS